MKTALISTIVCFALLSTFGVAASAGSTERSVRYAAAQTQDAPSEDRKAKRSPEEKMQARYPQPVKVGDLIGLPVLDAADRTLGYVTEVVRTSDDKILLIVPYARWFGWARSIGLLQGYRRPVAVPIETVVILGRQIDAVDMDRPLFDTAPTWSRGSERKVGADETIRIALGRR